MPRRGVAFAARSEGQGGGQRPRELCEFDYHFLLINPGWTRYLSNENQGNSKLIFP